MKRVAFIALAAALVSAQAPVAPLPPCAAHGIEGCTIEQVRQWAHPGIGASSPAYGLDAANKWGGTGAQPPQVQIVNPNGTTPYVGRER